MAKASDADAGKPAASAANPSGLGFDDILRMVALGIAPTAPRLPEQSLTSASYFGGYQKGFTSRMGFRGTLSFAVLRQMAERSMLLAACLSTRKHQVVRYGRVAQRSKRGEVGFRVVHAREHDKDFEVPDEFGQLCRDAEKMLMRPWRVYWDEGKVFKGVEPTLAGFIAKLTEDTLVLNRPVVELGLDAAGVPRAFGAIDGANVIPTFQALKYLTSVNRDIPKDFTEKWSSLKQAMQMASDRYGVDLDERTEYIYMLQGRPTAGFRDGQLIVPQFLPTTNVLAAGYPKSLCEQAIWAVLAEIMAMTANSRYFEFGSMAEVILAIKGQYQDKHIKDIEAMLQANVSGVGGMHRVPLIALPGGADDLQKIDIKQNHRDMLFDVYIQKLTNLTCAVFRMHPSEINEAPRAGDNSGSLQQASQQKQINMAQEQGLEALMEFYKQEVFDPILERLDPDLRLEWDYGKQEAEQVAVVLQYATFATVNEQRQMMGMDPLEGEEGEAVANPAIMADKAAKQQADQLKSQQKMQSQQLGAQQDQKAVEDMRAKETDQEQAQRIASRQRPRKLQLDQDGGRTRGGSQ